MLRCYVRVIGLKLCLVDPDDTQPDYPFLMGDSEVMLIAGIICLNDRYLDAYRMEVQRSINVARRSAPVMVREAHLEDDGSNAQDFDKVFEFPVLYPVKNFKFR